MTAMLMVLSPAKRLDFEVATPPARELLLQRPALACEAGVLAARLAELDAGALAELMHLSPTLAQLNAGRWAAWQARHTAANSRAALQAFAGDVYAGLDAASLTPADWEWAQDHLRILSGLYGLLRPHDRIQPHRLEMGTPLEVGDVRSLYAYWGARPARLLAAQARTVGAGVVLNLASQEYARAIDRAALKLPLVSVRFEQWHGGRWQVIGVHAKRARGLLARYAIATRAASPQALHGFAAEGWRYAVGASTDDEQVYRRRNAPQRMQGESAR